MNEGEAEENAAGAKHRVHTGAVQMVIQACRWEYVSR